MDVDLEALLTVCHKAPRDWQAKMVAADRAAELGLVSCEWWLRRMADLRDSNIRNNAVPTGSRVYGKFTTDSDFDWVVPILAGTLEENEKNLFAQRADPCSSGATGSRLYEDDPRRAEGETGYRLSGSYRFGPINMILVTNEKQLRVWRDGTQVALTLRGPVERFEAIAEFQRLTRLYL